MQYLSVCSGIEAATAAWHPLGWRPVGFAEIEKFPSRVLAHHYPTVPNLGNMTKFKDWPDAHVDCLVGGTPCQSFSVAGLRKGLEDPRGNLALTYCAILDRYKPRWFLWENVPGVLSTDGGRAFGSILGAMAELGYGWAYRVLDAQYVRVDGFGRAVPQRRRRVFVVGHLGNWRRAAKVLFEPESLLWNPPPRRQAGETTSGTLTSSLGRRGGQPNDDNPADYLIAKTLVSGGHSNNPLDENLVAHALRAEGFDASEDGTGRGTPYAPIAFDTTQITSRANYSNPAPGDPCHPLAAGAHAPAIAVADTLTSNGDAHSGFRDEKGLVPLTVPSWAVRRLTPRECERLQGFPDDYTLIPGAADGPRYKALGNSMAVNVMRWIGYRMALVEASSTIDVERIRTAMLAEYRAMRALDELRAAYA